MLLAPARAKHLFSAQAKHLFKCLFGLQSGRQHVHCNRHSPAVPLILNFLSCCCSLLLFLLLTSLPCCRSLSPSFHLILTLFSVYFLFSLCSCPPLPTTRPTLVVLYLALAGSGCELSPRSTSAHWFPGEILGGCIGWQPVEFRELCGCWC